MAEPKLISMKRTPEDQRKDMGEVAAPTSIAPDYPYGMCIHMDKDELDKAGIKEMPEVGSTVMIQVKAMVTMVRQSAGTGPIAEEETAVDFQITDLAIGEFTEPAYDTDDK